VARQPTLTQALSSYPDTAPPTRAPAQIATGVAPPHSLEAEQSVLGGILLSDRAMYGLVIEEGLKPEDFYRERHRTIYEAMLALYRESEPIDVLTVSEHLRTAGKLEEAGGKAAIDELTGGVPGLGGIRRYAQIVREHALMRRLLSTTYEIQASVLNHQAPPRELVEQAERAMLEVAHDDRQKDFRSIEEILDDELKKMERLSREHTSLTGTPSGFRDLDEITGGFQRGNLIIIAARPSMGKSALVTNIAENASIEHGQPVALFSLEMSETELAQRFVASQARIKGDELRKGRVADQKWPKILEASARLAAAPLYVDDSSDVGILEIRAKARRLHQQSRLGLIIVDYLQLLRPDGRVESRVEQVGQMSRGLKILARELDVPVIALSQLSRAVESRTDKRPILSDLRECVVGKTLVTLADGRRRPIADLVGSTPEVVAIDDGDRVVRARSDKVWRVGLRRVLRMRLASGRALTATPEHRVRTGAGWRTMGRLVVGDRVAVARRLPEPAQPQRWPEDRVLLLGHLIGGGSYLVHRPLRHTTASEHNSAAVAGAAEREFSATVERREGPGGRHELVIAGSRDHRPRAGVHRWLHELGIWNQRPTDKRMPDDAFRLASGEVACLLRHLWAADGTIQGGMRPDGRRDSQRAMCASRGTAYGGTPHPHFGASQVVLGDDATPPDDPPLAATAADDLFWDRVVAIEDAGEEPVFDLTVPGPACWLADGIVTHNSGQIEQDADLVAFIYRDEYYDKESERQGIADIILAKHRNGALGDVELTFAKEYPKFLNYTSPERYG
jgi:replicative DNA helicase